MKVIEHLRADLKTMKEENVKLRHEHELLKEVWDKKFLPMGQEGKTKT